MDTQSTHEPAKTLQLEELHRLDKLEQARSSAEGLLTAVVFNSRDNGAGGRARPLAGVP